MNGPLPTDPDREVAEKARMLLEMAGVANIMLATAESCTGGMLAAVLTGREGVSGAFDRGFVTYSARAKQEMLGIEPSLISRHGEVSEETARAMAEAAVSRSAAGLVCAITGFTGEAEPGGETGLVYIATLHRDGRSALRECHFGERGREDARHLTVLAALDMMLETAGTT